MSMAIETISSKKKEAQLMGNDVINILTREDKVLAVVCFLV